MYVIGLVVLIVGLIISVALHELGHLLPAKKFGAIVPEYWVGFGPTLWSKKKGETTYGVKAVLLGGYVRMVGMFPPAAAVGAVPKNTQKPTAVEQARAQSAAEIEEAQAKGATGTPFYNLSTPKKLVVMLGGPFMNLVLAFILTAVVLVGIGWQGPSTKIEEVAPLADGSASPAMTAGVQAGDRIVSWDGTPIDSWDDIRGVIAANQGTPVTVEVLREGALVPLELTPEVTPDGTYVGVVSAMERQRGSVTDAISQTGTQLAMTGKAIVALPVGMYRVVHSMVTGEERDPEGVLSVVGVARLAGEITSTGDAEANEGGAGSGLPAGLSVLDRVALLLSLLAALNIALFVFNLIPLPPLDGGHVVGAAWGGARNSWARLRGKPKPAPADTAKMVPLTYAVFAVLMGMTVILVFADLVKPLTFA